MKKENSGKQHRLQVRPHLFSEETLCEKLGNWDDHIIGPPAATLIRNTQVGPQNTDGVDGCDCLFSVVLQINGWIRKDISEPSLIKYFRTYVEVTQGEKCPGCHDNGRTWSEVLDECSPSVREHYEYLSSRVDVGGLPASDQIWSYMKERWGALYEVLLVSALSTDKVEYRHVL